MTTPYGHTSQPDSSRQPQYGQPTSPSQPGPGSYGQPSHYPQPGQYPQAGQNPQPGQYQPGQYQPAGGPGGPPRGPRPGTVIGASVMAWVGSALMILLGVVFLLAGALDPAELGLSADEAAIIQDFATIFGAVALIWGLLVVVMAALAFRGANWARWVLIVLGGLAILGSLINIISGAVAAIASLLWVGAAVALLLAPQSRAWFRAGSPSGQFNPGGYMR